jgi:glutathione S-transferase
VSIVQVIGLPGSNYVWAVRLALAEKGVAHESVSAPPHSPAATAVHPLGRIPVLRHGDIAIGESRAIIDYVDRAFDGPLLTPADTQARLRDDVWTSIVTTSIEPLLVRQYLFAYMFPGTPDGAPDRARIEGLLEEVQSALNALERFIEEEPDRAFGRVDAYLFPILFYLRNAPEGGTMLAARPALAAYLDRHMKRPSVQATMPPQPASA